MSDHSATAAKRAGPYFLRGAILVLDATYQAKGCEKKRLGTLIERRDKLKEQFVNLKALSSHLKEVGIAPKNESDAPRPRQEVWHVYIQR